MRYYIRKPNGAIMTREELEYNVPRHLTPLLNNRYAVESVAFMARESLGDGYRVVPAESQPPDHETRYFIRKPNGHLIADVDDARQYFSSAGNWNPRAWSGGFVVKEFADGFAKRKPGFAVVPREMLTGCGS